MAFILTPAPVSLTSPASIEDIQDALGTSALIDSSTIDATYNDGANTFSFAVKAPLLMTAGGSAAAPAYSFAGGAGESNKGLYSSATDEIAFAIGGVKSGHIGAFGLYIGPGTVATAPSLSGITDLNIRTQGSGVLNLSPADTKIVSVDTTNGLSIFESGSLTQFVTNRVGSPYNYYQMWGATKNLFIQAAGSSDASIILTVAGSTPQFKITQNADHSVSLLTQGGTNPIYPGGNNGQEFGGPSNAWKRFYAGGGTVANPAYTFGAAVGDNDTGMYLQATDAIGFATNGIKRLRIDQGSQVARMTLGNTDVLGLVEFLFEKDSAQTAKINFGTGEITSSSGKIEMVGPSGGLFRIDNSNNMQLGSGQLLGTSDGGFTIGYDESLSSGLRPKLLKVSEDIFVGGTTSSTVSTRSIFFGSLLASTAKIKSDGAGALNLFANSIEALRLSSSDVILQGLTGSTGQLSFGPIATTDKPYQALKASTTTQLLVHAPSDTTGKIWLWTGSTGQTGIVIDRATDTIDIATAGVSRALISPTSIITTVPVIVDTDGFSPSLSAFNSAVGLTYNTLTASANGAHNANVQADDTVFGSTLDNYSSRGTFASPTQHLSGDTLGGVLGLPWDGTGGTFSSGFAAFNGLSGMIIEVNENHTTSALGTRLNFYAVTNGTLTPVAAMGIRGDSIRANVKLDLTTNASLASTADKVLLGGYDIAAGERTLAIATEKAVATEVIVPDSTLTVRINGVNYKIPLLAV